VTTTDTTNTTEPPVLASRRIDPDVLAAARAFLAAAMRAMTPQLAADYATYQRLAEHEDRFAATAEAAGSHQAAATARACSARYRRAAAEMLVRIPLAAVVGECVA
jgi:hypothetical protein